MWFAFLTRNTHVRNRPAKYASPSAQSSRRTSIRGHMSASLVFVPVPSRARAAATAARAGVAPISKLVFGALTQNRLHHSAGHRSLGAAGGASRDERGRWSDFSRICEPQYRLSWFRFFISPDGMRSPMRMSSGTAPHSRSPLRTGPVGRKKPASPLALTDRGRIAPASRRSAGGAGVSTSAMGH